MNSPAGFSLRHVLTGHDDIIVWLSWSPDGNYIASCSADETIKLWNTQTGELFETFQGHSDVVVCLAWSPDGKFLASAADDRTIRIWDVSSSEAVHVFDGGLVCDGAWSPNGDILVSASEDGTITWWNTKTWKKETVQAAHLRGVSGLAWSPNGSVLASSSWDKTIKLWDARSRNQIFHTLKGHSGRVFDLAWMPDGERLVTASEDTTVRIWDAQSGRAVAVLEGHTDWVTCVRVSSLGEVIGTKGDDHTVRLWSARTGDCYAVLDERKSRHWLTGIAFHPHQPILATLGDNDRIIRLWDLDYRALASSTPVTSQYSNAKVVIIGDGAVGKSALALVLSGQAFHSTESTHGRHIRMLSTEKTKLSSGVDVFREVILWDLPGASSSTLIQHLHLNDVAVALIVFDAGRSADSFAGVSHWVRALRQARLNQGASLKSLKMFLVAAHADRHPIDTSIHRRAQSYMQEFGFDAYFETSAKTGRGISLLRDAIFDAIDWDILPAVTSTELFQTIKSFLMSEKEANRLLSTTEHLYRAFLSREGEPVPNEDLYQQFQTCIRLVESRGLIQVLSFGDYVLLQPELLDSYGAAILRLARDDQVGEGTVYEEDLSSRFRHTYFALPDATHESLLLTATLENFLRHEIAWNDGAFDSSRFVIPSQATRELASRPEELGQTVVFTFEGAILNIYSTLAVRLANSGVFKKQKVWRKAITYSAGTKGTYGLLLRELGEGMAEVTLFFDEETDDGCKWQFEDYVETHLQRHALAGSIQRKRVFVCQTCGTPVSSLQVERRLERGLDWISCNVCESRVSLADDKRSGQERAPVVFEIDRNANLQRDRQVARMVLQGKILTRDYDVFLCHNQEDKSFVREVAQQFKEEGILPWLDEWDLKPGVPWQQALESDLRNISTVAVFVGATGVGPWEQVELNALILEFVARNARVLPILLPNCEGKVPHLPALLMDLEWVDLRKSSTDEMRQLVALVTDERMAHSRQSGGRPQTEAKGETKDYLRRLAEKESELLGAQRRSDWATAHQLMVEAAKLLQQLKRQKEASSFALEALEIADDPMKLDGKGLREPLEVIADSPRPKRIEKWMTNCKHRTSVLSELRLIAASGKESLWNTIRNVTIEPWDRWFQTSTPNVNQISSLPREGDAWPAIRLTRLRLENIKGFHSLKLDFREQSDARSAPRMCSAIVGDNATGKTTLLQCIALGSLGHSLANQTDIRAISLLRRGARKGALELEFELTVDSNASRHEAITVAVGLELDQLEEDFRPLPNNKMTFRKSNSVEHWSALRRQVGFQWGLCCGYGAFRGLKEKSDKGTSMVMKAEIERVLSLFQPHSTLIDPTTLESILQSDVSSFSTEQKTIPLGISDEILRMLQAIIPGMEIEEEQGKKRLIEKYSRVCALASLSDGPNSMIGLLGHLIRHSLEILGWLRKRDDTLGTSGLSSPLKVVGIVLIDEVDLHLHPSWQRLALTQLQDAFPYLQFIVTTHSPLVLGGIPDGKVTVLRRDDEGRVSALKDEPSIKGWRVDQLLTGVHFDVASSYDVTTERLINQYAMLLNEKGSNDPAVLEAEKEIEKLKRPAEAKLEKAFSLLGQITRAQVEQMSQAERESMLSKILASKSQN